MFENNNKLYKNLPLLLSRYSGLDIPVDVNWNRIGVNLSGGADSALLCYLLCEIIIENNLKIKVDVITYQRCWETRPWQGYISVQVYNWLKNRFPDIIENRYTTFIPPELEHGVNGEILDGRSGDQIIVGSFNKFAAWEYSLDAVYNATSQNPDDSRDDRMINRDGTAENANREDVVEYFKSVDTFFLRPFRFVKKDWIVAQYVLREIVDLYNITRSCEGDINHHEAVRQACSSFKHYKEGMKIPVCNECWWCEERAWAESRLEKILEELDEL